MNDTQCKHEVHYSEKHDAKYCVRCLSWLEGRCSDPDCEYCSERPEKASRNDR
jgi:hypothetical protein